MLTAGERRELLQIEQGLRHTDYGFVWRQAPLQGLLRWAAPGRQAYLLALAVLMSALLRLAAAAGRLLIAFAEGGMLMGPPTLIVLRGTAPPGWEPGRVPGSSGSPVRGRPRPDGTDLRLG